MNKSVVISKTGGTEVMEIQGLEDLSKTDPAPDEVLIRHTAIGLNFIDICYRKGIYQNPLPFTLGTEAVGVVEKLGNNVLNLKVDDRVVYCTVKTGAYCQRRLIDQNYLIKVPDEVPDKQAASTMKGLTAHYLLKRAYLARSESSILVSAAAGGVGHILCQWAAHIGCTVIGAVGSKEKEGFAKKHGCQYVLTYDDPDFVEKVMDITKNEGVAAAYDSVGETTYDKFFRSLGMFGIYISYGASSGPIPAFDMMKVIESRSLFVTRPSIYHYKEQKFELNISALELFEMMKQRNIMVHVDKEYSIDEIKQAHQDLEGRKIVGSGVILL